MRNVSVGAEDHDLKRIPYLATPSLAELPAGRYILDIVVADRVSRASARQQARFEIE